MSVPEDDFNYEEVAVMSVSEEGGGWCIQREDGFSFFVKGDSPVVPRVGMTAHFYGRGLGHRVRGLFLDGTEVFYRTQEEDDEAFEIEIYGADAQDLLARWDNGDTVHTIEMGGLGPGYEQAIHIAVFEMIRYMSANPLDWERIDSDAAHEDMPREIRYWTGYQEDMDKVIFADGAPLKGLGLSGAQYSAAASLALKFVRYGPRHIMKDKRVEDRHIMVSRNFPG